VGWDVHLWPWRDGKPAEADAALILEVLGRYASGVRRESAITSRTTDGQAEIFGLDDPQIGFMIDNASGLAIWDAMVAVADAASLALHAAGLCPCCVTRAELLHHLPAEDALDARVVTSGAELLRACAVS